MKKPNYPLRTFRILLSCMLLGLAGISCSSALDEPQVVSSSETEDVYAQEVARIKFAEIISKVIYDSKEVREFLKAQAVQEFDFNTDILYGFVKQNSVGKTTFRDILLDYTTEEELSKIERSIPLLNIFVPEFPFFNVSVANLDCDDKELPVAVKSEDGMKLFLNGEYVMTVPTGELPAFHTVVLNDNSRVKVVGQSRSGEPKYTFISSNFDGRNKAKRKRIAPTSQEVNVSDRAKTAYEYFWSNEADSRCKSFQRDYLYYGITPVNGNGNLNHLVREYISSLCINPKAYFNISDQTNLEPSSLNDPIANPSSVTVRGREMSWEEQLQKLWSEGCYNFKFEIVSVKSTLPIVVYIPLKPAEIWDLHIKVDYEHGTWFKKSKLTYSIDPSKFTERLIVLDENLISFGRWDLSVDALERYITISEEDKAATYTYTQTSELTKLTSVKLNGSVKAGLGTKVNGELSVGFDSSTTTKEIKTFTYTRTEEDDMLGRLMISYFDPVIESRAGSIYYPKVYSTGVVEFTINVK